LFSYSHIYIFVIFVFSLHFTYIGDNVSFKCGGRDLGCVLICFFKKKKKKKKKKNWRRRRRKKKKMRKKKRKEKKGSDGGNCF